MQACNLQNLPENYTMRYCISLVFVSSYSFFRRFLRLIPRHDMAITLLRCRRRQGAHRGLCIGEDVCAVLPHFLATANVGNVSGRRTLLLEMNHMDT